jgi:hypothetical protein
LREEEATKAEKEEKRKRKEEKRKAKAQQEAQANECNDDENGDGENRSEEVDEDDVEEIPQERQQEHKRNREREKGKKKKGVDWERVRSFFLPPFSSSLPSLPFLSFSLALSHATCTLSLRLSVFTCFFCPCLPRRVCIFTWFLVSL